MKKLCAVTAVLCICAGAACAQTGYTILHNFDGVTGASPRGSLVSDGSALYGMTYSGGQNYFGAVFSIKPDGSGYTVLHDFAASPGDGRNPWGSLLSDGSALYGMTSYGGTYSYGTIFSLKPDGSSYTILHDFDDITGASPRGNLLSDGSTLHGMTYNGGAYYRGTIFSIGKDGSGYTVTHDFGAAGDGRYPRGSLVSNGSSLFGMTSYGPYQYGRGTLFSIKPDGSGYTILHQFDGLTGASPRGSLIANGSTLYGMTTYGGSAFSYGTGAGTVFSMNTDGTGFTLLHEFAAGPDDGATPLGTLLSEDDRLFGLTIYGGGFGYGFGTVFSVRPDGTNFTKIRSFQGPPKDGMSPWGSLISDGTTLYGMTSAGGQYYNYSQGGTVFSLPIPTPVPTATPTPVPGLLSLRIWTDAQGYAAGDTLTLSYELINPLSPIPFPADAYLALRAPDGRVFFYGPRELGSGQARFTTAVVPVYVFGRIGDDLSGTAARFLMPPIQAGNWTWYGVIVPKGKNPFNPADRVSNLATSIFDFTP